MQERIKKNLINVFFTLDFTYLNYKHTHRVVSSNNRSVAQQGGSLLKSFKPVGLKNTLWITPKKTLQRTAQIRGKKKFR